MLFEFVVKLRIHQDHTVYNKPIAEINDVNMATFSTRTISLQVAIDKVSSQRVVLQQMERKRPALSYRLLQDKSTKYETPIFTQIDLNQEFMIICFSNIFCHI